MQKVLVINCGSSSIKYEIFEMPARHSLASGLLERIGEPLARLKHHVGDREFVTQQPAPTHREGLTKVIAALTDGEAPVIASVEEIAAVGHRVVHGAEAFVASCLITDPVIKTIEACQPLAPLHNPPNLLGIRTAQALMPGTPQVAVFDTAFHQTMPKHAFVYALPYELYEQDRIRRYGFHGTSHRYVSLRAAETLGRARDDVNLITCHLGNGCSVTAVKNGCSVDCSLGMTPVEGLVMGTRSGDIDAGVLLHLMDTKAMTSAQINALINKRSGLLGVSGVSNDMRAVHDAADKGNERAKLAISLFCYRLKKYIGAYLAVLGRVDAVVFTGGIGENAVFVRRETCAGLDGLGIILDERRNATVSGDGADVAADRSPVRILVIKTDEEALIAQDTWDIGVASAK
jgi:acetate kinase